MRKIAKFQALAALVFLGAAGLVTGCKSAPELTQDQAKTMIQARYDGQAGTVFNIAVNDRGMQQGVHDGYWAGLKRYPNGYWADFKLTPEGTKVVKLPNGGDTIQWRPESPNSPNYTVVVVPLVPCKLKARSIGAVQTLADNRTVAYTEDVDLSSLPSGLQSIAENPGNEISTQRVATFTLTNGAWTLQSIE